jgi:small subunit ribosomal protein S6
MMLKLYETMYIADPSLSEQEVEALTERLKSEIVEKGGEVVDLQHLGKKRLAYSIKRKKDGFYFLLYFRLAAGRVAELRAGYRLNESILRFLIVKKEEREVKFAGERTNVAEDTADKE